MDKKSSSRDPKRGSFSSEKFNLLQKIIVRYHHEAEKCASVGAYYAACIRMREGKIEGSSDLCAPGITFRTQGRLSRAQNDISFVALVVGLSTGRTVAG
jgi:hypothetical protein